MELIKGKEYKRKELHDFYGGQRQGGIATPKEHPLIFIISSRRGEDHGYVDGWIDENKFLEYENVHNELYGTPIQPIRDSVKFGHSVLLDIDVKGAYSIMNTNHFDCCSIFIKTPSIEILRERLVKRDDLTDDQINKRIEEAKNELKKSTYFDHLIINDDLNDAFNDTKRIISSL